MSIICNRLGCVMVGVFASSVFDGGSRSYGRVKPQTINLVFVVFPLNTLKHYGVSKDGLARN